MRNITLNIKNTLKNIPRAMNLTNPKAKTLFKNIGNIVNKAGNFAIDFGIRAALPDFLEDSVINIKDALLENGLKGGLNEIKKSIFNFSESAKGIFTGSFKNVSQLNMATKKTGLIRMFSKGLSSAITSAIKTGVIDKKIGRSLRSAKSTFLNTFSDSLRDNFTNVIKNAEKINEYCDEWDKFYEDRNFKEMTKVYNKITQLYPEIVPITTISKKINNVMELHKWIEKNNSFDYHKGLESALGNLVDIEKDDF